ncbi:queuosine precursor transporter [Helicobacter trogontum]|uniref:Probable queuosine precursor transporter n=1 Tax=Helicobacter trogontum TaxID=50960 RepID=A0A099VJK5_9HELI|nr:queuosine precursor transporter [Helicobacter trogontum]MCI5785874.1 queuosine precursor transporter [Helicobacter trogontum]MDY5184851.1 queuosine precursor transporter [Helicobacter trogontum]TLD84154.1 VUT family protein [Helicobacter trogontum]TLD99064.1 VUT family protein [Helicobacter trogontum]
MSYVPPQEKQMSENTFVVAVMLFTCVIVASNYLVSFTIGSVHIPFFNITLELNHVTYGALTYPLSFLIMDVLSEKHSRKDVLRALRYGLLFAFLPSCAIAFISNEPHIALRIAVASVSAFFVAQFLDVVIFYQLKKKFPSLWWFRNGVSACVAQCVDTFVFFHIAFFGVLPYYDVFMLFLFDYGIKSLVNLLDIPIFYFIAIKTYKKVFYTRK